MGDYFKVTELETESSYEILRSDSGNSVFQKLKPEEVKVIVEAKYKLLLNDLDRVKSAVFPKGLTSNTNVVQQIKTKIQEFHTIKTKSDGDYTMLAGVVSNFARDGLKIHKYKTEAKEAVDAKDTAVAERQRAEDRANVAEDALQAKENDKLETVSLTDLESKNRSLVVQLNASEQMVISLQSKQEKLIQASDRFEGKERELQRKVDRNKSAFKAEKIESGALKAKLDISQEKLRVTENSFKAAEKKSAIAGNQVQLIQKQLTIYKMNAEKQISLLQNTLTQKRQELNTNLRTANARAKDVGTARQLLEDNLRKANAKVASLKKEVKDVKKRAETAKKDVITVTAKSKEDAKKLASRFTIIGVIGLSVVIIVVGLYCICATPDNKNQRRNRRPRIIPVEPREEAPRPSQEDLEAAQNGPLQNAGEGQVPVPKNEHSPRRSAISQHSQHSTPETNESPTCLVLEEFDMHWEPAEQHKATVTVTQTDIDGVTDPVQKKFLMKAREYGVDEVSAMIAFRVFDTFKAPAKEAPKAKLQRVAKNLALARSKRA